MSYCQLNEEEAKLHKPRVVFVNEENAITEVTNYEKHGEIRK